MPYFLYKGAEEEECNSRPQATLNFMWLYYLSILYIIYIIFLYMFMYTHMHLHQHVYMCCVSQNIIAHGINALIFYETFYIISC